MDSNLLQDIPDSENEERKRDFSNILKTCIEEQRKYLKFKNLFNICQQSLVEDNGLCEEVKEKIDEILMDPNCLEVLCIENQGFRANSSSLLGLCVSNATLNYVETTLFKKFVFKKFNQKQINIKTDIASVLVNKQGEALFDTMKSISLHNDYKNLIEMQQKLDNQRTIHVSCLETQKDYLEKLVDLRTKRLPEVLNCKIKEYKAESQLLLLRSKVLSEKVRTHIFTDSSITPKAYKELYKDIESQLEECEHEIEELSDLKRQYEQISCREYNKILTSYLQYKTALENKKQLYQSLNIV